MPTQPNVILICVDQWRGDCLGVAGHPVVQTPYLDQLALSGARFRRAYSACPSCIPARAALYTGLTQRSHGRVGYRDGMPWKYPVTMAGEFKRHGFDTCAVGKLHVYPERSKLGFDRVVLHDGYLHFVRRQYPFDRSAVDDYQPWLRRELGRRDADDFEHGLNCNSFVARPWDKPEHVHPTNFVVTQSLDWLRRRRNAKPFFLFLSFHRPHPPLDPPAWAFEQYLHERMPAPPVGDWQDELLQVTTPTPQQPALSYGKVAPRVLHRARAGYYGHMTHIDHQLNRFFETLHDYGHNTSNTCICFVSDHGEMIGDHHLFRKSLPYEGSARVPLILVGPRSAGIPAGRVADQVVELRDVLPTLLECAGLPVPAAVEGRSFLAAARGDTQPLREYLHGEHLTLGGSFQWLTDGHEKYVWFSQNGNEQLFDLDRDPQEKHNLATPRRCAAWRKRLIQELAGREEGFTDGRRLIPGRPVQPCLTHLRRQAGQA